MKLVRLAPAILTTLITPSVLIDDTCCDESSRRTKVALAAPKKISFHDDEIKGGKPHMQHLSLKPHADFLPNQFPTLEAVIRSHDASHKSAPEAATDGRTLGVFLPSAEGKTKQQSHPLGCFPRESSQ